MHKYVRGDHYIANNLRRISSSIETNSLHTMLYVCRVYCSVLADYPKVITGDIVSSLNLFFPHFQSPLPSAVSQRGTHSRQARKVRFRLPPFQYVAERFSCPLVERVK